MKSQYDLIWDYLRKHGKATIKQLSDAGGGNWVHKRLAEMTDADGWFYRANARLVRESLLHKGRHVRVYRLVRGA